VVIFESQCTPVFDRRLNFVAKYLCYDNVLMTAVAQHVVSYGFVVNDMKRSRLIHYNSRQQQKSTVIADSDIGTWFSLIHELATARNGAFA